MRALVTTLLTGVLLVAACVTPAFAAPSKKGAAFSPSQLQGQCAEIYADWIGQNAPRAFALSQGGADCGASWNHATAEEARADAMGQCEATGASGCAIVAEDATPPLTLSVGDVVLIRDCAADYQNWMQQATPKAFYATDDGASCGAAWGYGSLQQSAKEARRLCLEYGVPCRQIDAAE